MSNAEDNDWVMEAEKNQKDLDPEKSWAYLVANAELSPRSPLIKHFTLTPGMVRALVSRPRTRSEVAFVYVMLGHRIANREAVRYLVASWMLPIIVTIVVALPLVFDAIGADPPSARDALMIGTVVVLMIWHLWAGDIPATIRALTAMRDVLTFIPILEDAEPPGEAEEPDAPESPSPEDVDAPADDVVGGTQ